jgi:hypothetical protein
MHQDKGHLQIGVIMTMYKSEMIRDVYKDDLQCSNKEIKAHVWRRYRTRVGSNEIINAIGSEKERLSYGNSSDFVIKAGNDFIRTCGSYEQARRILAVCGGTNS